jgi:hypothetical protein
MNDPLTAWTLQVYLRDRGLYLWLAPSRAVYGGWQALVERYDMIVGYHAVAQADAETVQDAARRAAESVCDLSGFAAWRERWEQRALVEE